MQTIYNVDPAAGVVGGIAEAGSKTERAKVAGGVVRPGQYVVFAGDSCAHPVAAPTAMTRGGIVVRNPYKQNDGVYAAGEMVDVLVDGAIFVATENAVLVDTQAFVRVTATGGQQLGALRSDASVVSTVATAVAIPGLIFRKAGQALVKLEVNKSTS